MRMWRLQRALRGIIYKKVTGSNDGASAAVTRGCRGQSSGIARLGAGGCCRWDVPLVASEMAWRIVRRKRRLVSKQARSRSRFSGSARTHVPIPG